MVGRHPYDNNCNIPFDVRSIVDDSFDAIQIRCDREVSRGAFVFVDKCKAIMFSFSLTTC